MAMLGLGSGQQNHNLRKRKPKLISEEEMKNKLSFTKSKSNLRDIADQLNAVNNNYTLEKAFDHHL